MSGTTRLINARIRTFDPARPVAEWLVFGNGIILAVGSGEAPSADQTIDAGGRLVLPGFQDAHIHLIDGGIDLVATADLFACETLSDIQSALAAHAARNTGALVQGAGWQCGFFGDHNLTRAVIDAVVPDRPAIIMDGNFHNACINSAAIALVGLDETTPDPTNGHFVRDKDGKPTGMLHEDAIYWVKDRLPGLDRETVRAGLKAGQAHANRHGITGILDAAIAERHRDAYGWAEDEGLLTIRVAGTMHVQADEPHAAVLDRLCAWREARRSRDFHLHSAKFFLDGGFENRTAATLTPYADPVGGNAPTMFSREQVMALFPALDDARFQIHVHCIGDAAARLALDGFEAARQQNGTWPSLHQIAHCQLVHPDDRARFAELGVMANFQPLWACNDPIIPDQTMAMIGKERAPWTYATRTILDLGAPYCINSDWPVTTLNPFEIIGTAVTREPPRRRGRSEPFFAREAMTVEEAVAGYTIHAAAACWRSDFTGQLRPGYSADAIILDRDIFACDRHAIAETDVLATLFKGRFVHASDPF